MKQIDLRSDTLTLPTDEMRQAMYDAVVGDDVYGEDPSVNELQKKAAQMLGKEAALFVVSGTMGNQIAIMCSTEMGDEIIVEESSHMVQKEVGATARLSGVNYSIVANSDHRIRKEDVLARIRTKNVHHPVTSMISLENPLGANGTVMSLKEMKDIYEVAQEHNIHVHLDGARIFNAAVYLDVDVKEITQYADSIMFCLSKGLCAPVGSILCGSQAFIDKALRMRKLLGGGMRQAGVLAAPGLVSLEKMWKRLQDDHANARYLGEKLNEIDGFSVDMSKVQTNMVFCQIDMSPDDFNELQSQLDAKNIKIVKRETGLVRLVIHNDISREDLDYVISSIKEII